MKHIDSRLCCDLVLDHHDVSRYHVVLTHQADTFRSEDLNSANDTYVNSGRIGAPIDLKDRDQIRIGSTVIIYVVTLPDKTAYEVVSKDDLWESTANQQGTLGAASW